jgi:hypothetical protein
MESVYKFVRDHLSVKPTLTLPQFFSDGFAEHKMIFVCEVIDKAKKKAAELKKEDDAKHPKREHHKDDQPLHTRSDNQDVTHVGVHDCSNNTSMEEDTYTHVVAPVSITVPAVKVIKNAVQSYKHAEKENINPQSMNYYGHHVYNEDDESEEQLPRPPIPYSLPEKQPTHQAATQQPGLPMIRNGITSHQELSELKQVTWTW